MRRTHTYLVIAVAVTFGAFALGRLTAPGPKLDSGLAAKVRTLDRQANRIAVGERNPLTDARVLKLDRARDGWAWSILSDAYPGLMACNASVCG